MIMRELTKIHEQLAHKPKFGLSSDEKMRGETTIVIGAVPGGSGLTGASRQKVTRAAELFGYLTKSLNVVESRAMRSVAAALSMTDEEAVKAVRAGNKLAKQQRMKGA